MSSYHVLPGVKWDVSMIFTFEHQNYMYRARIQYLMQALIA